MSEHVISLRATGLGGGVGIGMMSCSCGWNEPFSGDKDAARDLMDKHRLVVFPNAKPWRVYEAERLLAESTRKTEEAERDD